MGAARRQYPARRLGDNPTLRWLCRDDQLSRSRDAQSAPRTRLDRRARLLAAGHHDRGGPAGAGVLLHAPEDASHRSAYRAGKYRIARPRSVLMYSLLYPDWLRLTIAGGSGHA